MHTPRWADRLHSPRAAFPIRVVGEQRKIAGFPSFYLKTSDSPMSHKVLLLSLVFCPYCWFLMLPNILFQKTLAAQSCKGLYSTVGKESSLVNKRERAEGSLQERRKDGRKGGWTIKRKEVSMDRRKGQKEGGKFQKVRRHNYSHLP